MRSTPSFQLILGSTIMALAGVCAPACDGGETTSTGGSGGDPTTGGSTTGGGGDTAGTGGSGGADCGPGAELCGDTCTVTAFDPANCGECGKACDAEQEVCSEGQCVPACGGGLDRCGDDCVDTTSDTAHCGACENACPGAADACIEGQCIAQVPPKGVYTMTNDVAGNKILTFPRAADGSLSSVGAFTATGGTGTGAGLGNQHGLIFDAASNRFFAVNAGDGSISMLALELDGSLTLLSNVKSGGARPVSVTVSGNIVYVVNAGVAAENEAGNISGFEIAGDTLVPIPGSTQPLSAQNPGPAQIQFSPDGKTLVVTERMTNLIDTYAVTGGVAAGPVVIPSAGQTPFGFDFTADQRLIVSEAWGGQAGLSSTSSYSLGAAGALVPISGAVPTTRTAACWLVVAGDHAYVANAQTNDITGFTIAPDGSLSLMSPDGVDGQTAGGATDEDVTDDEDFLYVVGNGAHVLSVFQINADGSLTKKPDFEGLPSGVNGLVAR